MIAQHDENSRNSSADAAAVTPIRNSKLRNICWSHVVRLELVAINSAASSCSIGDFSLLPEFVMQEWMHSGKFFSLVSLVCRNLVELQVSVGLRRLRGLVADAETEPGDTESDEEAAEQVEKLQRRYSQHMGHSGSLPSVIMPPSLLQRTKRRSVAVRRRYAVSEGDPPSDDHSSSAANGKAKKTTTTTTVAAAARWPRLRCLDLRRNALTELPHSALLVDALPLLHELRISSQHHTRLPASEVLRYCSGAVVAHLQLDVVPDGVREQLHAKASREFLAVASINNELLLTPSWDGGAAECEQRRAMCDAAFARAKKQQRIADRSDEADIDGDSFDSGFLEFIQTAFLHWNRKLCDMAAAERRTTTRAGSAKSGSSRAAEAALDLVRSKSVSESLVAASLANLYLDMRSNIQRGEKEEKKKKSKPNMQAAAATTTTKVTTNTSTHAGWIPKRLKVTEHMGSEEEEIRRQQQQQVQEQHAQPAASDESAKRPQHRRQQEEEREAEHQPEENRQAAGDDNGNEEEEEDWEPFGGKKFAVFGGAQQQHQHHETSFGSDSDDEEDENEKHDEEGEGRHSFPTFLREQMHVFVSVGAAVNSDAASSYVMIDDVSPIRQQQQHYEPQSPARDKTMPEAFPFLKSLPDFCLAAASSPERGRDVAQAMWLRSTSAAMNKARTRHDGIIISTAATPSAHHRYRSGSGSVVHSMNQDLSSPPTSHFLHVAVQQATPTSAAQSRVVLHRTMSANRSAARVLELAVLLPQPETTMTMMVEARHAPNLSPVMTQTLQDSSIIDMAPAPLDIPVVVPIALDTTAAGSFSSDSNNIIVINSSSSDSRRPQQHSAAAACSSASRSRPRSAAAATPAATLRGNYRAALFGRSDEPAVGAPLIFDAPAALGVGGGKYEITHITVAGLVVCNRTTTSIAALNDGMHHTAPKQVACKLSDLHRGNESWIARKSFPPPLVLPTDVSFATMSSENYLDARKHFVPYVEFLEQRRKMLGVDPGARIDAVLAGVERYLLARGGGATGIRAVRSSKQGGGDSASYYDAKSVVSPRTMKQMRRKEESESSSLAHAASPAAEEMVAARRAAARAVEYEARQHHKLAGHRAATPAVDVAAAAAADTAVSCSMQGLRRSCSAGRGRRVFLPYKVRQFFTEQHHQQHRSLSSGD